MSLLVIDRFSNPLAPAPTSGSGALGWARKFVIRVSGTLGVPGTSGDKASWPLSGEIAPAEQTSSGYTSTDASISTEAAITELRRLSGLTWDQLARLFGVARRSIHFWASGKPMNAVNEERLGRLLVVVRYVDRGTPRDTRTALLTALPDGVIPYELLLNDDLDEVVVRLGSGSALARPRLLPLALSARVAKTPASPEELVGALHDSVHQEAGRSRAGRSVKIKSESDGNNR